MFLTVFKSKIHRATVTEANLNYMGSITIDETLLKAADIIPGEKVQVVNNNNGSRLETYVIAGAADSGIICLNGAAARLVQPGDTVIIITYAIMTKAEASAYQPRVIMVDEKNQLIKLRGAELHGEITPPGAVLPADPV